MSILELLRTRREEKAGDVMGLARMAAAGEAPDVDRLIQAMTAAGMDDEAFNDLVDMIERRDRYRATAARGLSAAVEVQRLEACLKKIDDDHSAVEQKYIEGRRPVQAALDDAREVVADANRARNALALAHNLPAELTARREAARKRLLDAAAAVHDQRENVGRLVEELAGARAKLAGDTSGRVRMNQPDAEAIVKYGPSRIEAARAELDRLIEIERQAQQGFDAVEKACLEF
jgi:hypothetical protein